MTYWWCLTHAAVEEGDGCPNKQRLGPYASREQAASAPDRTRARTAENDARDQEEDDF
jgi:hypothetical protein